MKIPDLGPAEYRAELTAIQSRAWRSEDPLEKTRSFWIMEKLSAEFFKVHAASSGLRDQQLPLEVRPIAHCGMGIGAVERCGFQAAELRSQIDRFSHPDYRLFAYESVGAMLGVYAPGPFYHLARGFQFLGFLPMAQLTPPDPASFLKAFGAEHFRLLSHGYGRLLYFRNYSVGAAIRAACRQSVFDPASCIRGIAFAMAMVNSADVKKVMSFDYHFGDSEAEGAFDAGLVYALVFWELMSPGFLEMFSTKNSLHGRRIEWAAREMERVRQGGSPLAFDLLFQGTTAR